ncbi:hypothetical protein FACS1894170_07150 [Planctomycetales bacterium]|nr:hypothetical protein FACS1894170_07150 [Planctomycetales bacterium]
MNNSHITARQLRKQWDEFLLSNGFTHSGKFHYVNSHFSILEFHLDYAPLAKGYYFCGSVSLHEIYPTQPKDLGDYDNYERLNSMDISLDDLLKKHILLINDVLYRGQMLPKGDDGYPKESFDIVLECFADCVIPDLKKCLTRDGFIEFCTKNQSLAMRSLAKNLKIWMRQNCPDLCIGFDDGWLT